MKGWKTLFVIFLISLLVNVFVRGDCTILDNANLVSYYSFDNTYTDSGTGGYDITEVGTIFTDGVLNQAVYLSGAANSLLNVSDVTYFDATTQPMTFCFAFNYNNTATANQVIMDKFTVNNGWWIYFYATSTKLAFDIWGATTNILECQTNNTYASKTWYHMCVTWSGVGADKCAGVYWYQNGNLITTVAAQNNDPGAMTGNTKKLEIGHRSSALRSTGYLDEIFISKTALSATNISLLYNGGVLCNPTIAPPASNESTFTSINWDTASPLNDTAYNNVTISNSTIHFNFNVTVTNITNMNCSLFYNDSGGGFGQHLAWAYINMSTTGNKVYNLTFPLDINYTFRFMLRCYDFINVSRTADSSIKTIVWDTIPPNLLMSSNFINNTRFTRLYDYNITFNVTVSDTNLYAFNQTVFRLNNSDRSRLSIFSHINMSNINVTSYKYGAEYTLTGFNVSLLPSEYEIRVEGWDSHTGDVLKYDESLTDNKLSYNGVQFYCDNIKTLDYIKETDRLKPVVTFDKVQTIQKCYYKGGELIKVKNSLYPNHYVDWTNKLWIDDYLGTSKLLDKNTLEITFYSSKGISTITTDSFGDLNYATSSWFFNVSLGQRFYARDAVANTTIYNFTVNVWNGTIGGTLLNSLTDNGTGYVVFNITSGTYPVNISAYRYVMNSTNVSFTENGTHTTYLYAANSLYLFLYDEKTNTLITNDCTIQVVNYDNTSYEYTINSSYIFQSGFSTGDYEIRYWCDDYQMRLYFTTISTSTTQSIRLYLLNNTLSANAIKNIDVVDDSATPVDTAVVSMLRHYIDCNCYRVVEMTKTNTNGKSFIFAELYTAPYKFMISYLDVNRLSSDVMRLDTRDLYFKITLLSSGLLHYWDAINTGTELTFNSTSNIWSYSWSDTSGVVSGAKIKVVQNRMYDTRTLYEYNTTGTSGVLEFNQTAYDGENGEFIATGFVLVNSTDYLVETVSMSYSSSHLVYGMSGLLLSLMIILVLAGIGVYKPSTSIALCLVGIIVTRLMGILYLQITMLVGIVIVGIIFIAHIKD